MIKSGQEQLDGWNLARYEESAARAASMMQGRMGRAKREGLRCLPVALLSGCESESCPLADRSLGDSTCPPTDHPQKVLANRREDSPPRDAFKRHWISTSTGSGSSRNVLVHCLAVRTTSSYPALVCTPTWTGSRMVHTEEPTSSTATLLQSPRSVSPTATGPVGFAKGHERGRAADPRPDLLRDLAASAG